MGLSSSQARLLDLTSRMHQIEYKAAKLEAQKLQMANESTRVYEDYLEALDKTKVQYKILTTDGSTTYSDISSYTDFLKAGYAIDFKGVVYDGTSAYTASDGTYVSKTAITVTDSNAEDYPDFAVGDTIYQALDASTYYEASEVTTTAVALNWAQLCHDAFGASLTNPPSNVSEVITNLINSGDVTLVEADTDGTFAKETDEDFANFETSVSTNTGLQEVSDEIALKKAEAQYEADMKKIDNKDTKYDTDLAALETERNAIKQEMETLETVAKDNVERTFKLFS
ncbi:MAG: hypothetical protein LUB59_03550 [Candidatus Gastranaerophilales bacterium]|nr:hypothetical protein [Candidatus Gastranaerophilales bacterium]